MSQQDEIDEITRLLVLYDNAENLSKLRPTIKTGAITVEMAMRVLEKALAKDKSPGSYYYTWQSNIACCIMDNSHLGHAEANDIAMKFLNLLITTK